MNNIAITPYQSIQRYLTIGFAIVAFLILELVAGPQPSHSKVLWSRKAQLSSIPTSKRCNICPAELSKKFAFAKATMSKLVIF